MKPPWASEVSILGRASRSSFPLHWDPAGHPACTAIPEAPEPPLYGRVHAKMAAPTSHLRKALPSKRQDSLKRRSGWPPRRPLTPTRSWQSLGRWAGGAAAAVKAGRPREMAAPEPADSDAVRASGFGGGLEVSNWRVIGVWRQDLRFVTSILDNLLECRCSERSTY